MTTEPASDTTAARKARGAFFTPPAVTTFLTAWAIRDSSDRVLEPSCGDGAFIAAIVHRMRTLGGGRHGCVVAHELHPESAAQSQALLSAVGYGEVLVGDFLASPADPTFDRSSATRRTFGIRDSLERPGRQGVRPRWRRGSA